MRNRLTYSMTVIAAAALPAVLALAVKPTTAQTPTSDVRRTAEGKPDFSGVWQAVNTAHWDLQTHAAQIARVLQPGLPHGGPVPAAPVVALGAAGGVPGGLGVVEGNEIPYQPSALAKKKENYENWLDRDPEIKCFFPGVPRAMYMPYPFQIFQGTSKIQMVFEFANAHRTIHMSKIDPYPNTAWMGHSVGRWEGDTLVVDVTEQVESTWFDRAGNFHSDALHVVERYTPISRDAVRYEATIEDPKVFTRPWKIRMPFYRRLEENAQLSEYRCVEMAEEALFGHLRKQPVVKRWEGRTMIVDVTRKVPPGDALYER